MSSLWRLLSFHILDHNHQLLVDTECTLLSGIGTFSWLIYIRELFIQLNLTASCFKHIDVVWLHMFIKKETSALRKGLQKKKGHLKWEGENEEWIFKLIWITKHILKYLLAIVYKSIITHSLPWIYRHLHMYIKI